MVLEKLRTILFFLLLRLQHGRSRGRSGRVLAIRRLRQTILKILDVLAPFGRFDLFWIVVGRCRTFSKNA